MAKQRAPRVRLPAIELVAPLALLGLALSAPARAQTTVVPSITVRETYSDNAQLQPDDQAHGQFITDITPGVNVAVNTSRVKLFALLNAHLYEYSGSNSGANNTTSVQLNTGGKANLIEDLFYVDGSATRSRQSVSAFGQQFQQDYSDSNSDIITTYRISPYLTHRFGNFANAQLRYTHDSVKSNRNILSNSTGNSVGLNVNSGPSFTTFGWDGSLYHQELEDPLAGKSEIDNAVGTLRYRVQQTLSFYTNLGYDKYTYQGLGGTTKGKSYAVGFTWTPSLRTSIDASAGHRYFGKTYSLAATVRSRKTIWSASYHDDITTTRAQFLQPGSIDTATLLDASFASAFPDPVQRRQAIDAYIRALGLPTSVANNVNYFSNRLILQKQGQAAVALNGSRSTAIASFSNTKRTALSPSVVDSSVPTGGIGIPNLNDDTRQRTLSLALNYRLSARLAATANAVKSHVVALSTNVEQDQTLFTFVLTEQFDKKLSGTLELRRNQGGTFDALGRGYRENAITASLSYRL
jgi:uncharacterized protein (PEP-CTERM system associated)